MVKEKTISVRHYVNKNLKPKIIDGVNHYPVYVQVNFDGKNTQFKLKILGQAIFVSEKLELDDPKFKDFRKEISRDSLMLKEIIRYENNLLNRDFKLSGIGDRLSIYKKEVDNAFEVIISSFIYEYVKDYMTYRAYEEMRKVELFIDKIAFIIEHVIGQNFELDDVNLSETEEKSMRAGLFFLSTIFLRDKLNIDNNYTLYELLVQNHKQKFYNELESKYIKEFGHDANVGQLLFQGFEDKQHNHSLKVREGITTIVEKTEDITIEDFTKLFLSLDEDLIRMIYNK